MHKGCAGSCQAYGLHDWAALPKHLREYQGDIRYLEGVCERYQLDMVRLLPHWVHTPPAEGVHILQMGADTWRRGRESCVLAPL